MLSVFLSKKIILTKSILFQVIIKKYCRINNNIKIITKHEKVLANVLNIFI